MLGVLLGFLFAFLFGAMLLMLALGARNIEQEWEKREQEVHRQVAEERGAVRFFAPAWPSIPQTERQPDEALLLRVAKYLETEQSLAEAFVSQPSIENLYRDSSRKLLGH
jgi:hypothetical protein